MKLLLDTHVLLWWWCCPQLLSPRVRERLENPRQAVVVSVASLWELSEAEQREELPELSPVIWQLPELVLQEGFALLPIQPRHGLLAGQWREAGPKSASMKRLRPIDLTGRLLLAQAELENLTLVSADTTLRRTGVRCLW